jgi:membrane protein DedA with SNARE-associated domain
MALIDYVLSTLGTPHFGYFLVFAFALLEASPLFGMFIPGQTIVMVAGFLSEMGILNVWYVFGFAAVGAILGDIIGYILGRRYGYSFIASYGKYFLFKKEYFEKTKRMVNDHTGKALFFGRFTSLTRAFAPFVVGSSKTSFAKFIFYDIIGGIAWAVVYVGIGYIFGEGYKRAAGYFGTILAVAIVFSILLIYGFKFINKRRRIFAKYHVYALTLNIICIYLFSKMLEDVLESEALTRIDMWFNQQIMHMWTPLMNKLIIFATLVASTTSLLIFCIGLLAFLIYRKKWYTSMLMVSSLVGGWILAAAIKYLVHRPRPGNGLVDVAGYSFPSGHATMAIIFFCFLVYSFKDDFEKRSSKVIFISVDILLFLFVGASRIYLNVHYFSDVVAGFALGLFWLTLLILFSRTTIEYKKDHFRGLKKRLDESAHW